MKQILHFFKIIFLFSLFLTSLFSETRTDDFENGNLNGWNQTQGVSSPGGGVPTQVLELTNYPSGDWNYKVYSFGTAFANTAVNIKLDMYAANNWESNDLVYFHDFVTGITENYNFPDADGNTDPVSRQLDYNTTTDSNGNVILYIYPNPSSNSEVLYIDNISITTLSTPPIMGNIPNGTLTQYAYASLALSDYVTQTDGDAIRNYYYSCPGLNGISLDAFSGLLSGYPIDTGTFTCSAWAEDKDGESNVDTFTVTVVGTGSNQPPVIMAIPPFSFIVGTQINLSLASYVIPTDGNPVLSYGLTGTLPAGLSFDTATGVISGIATVEGTETLYLSASDADGTSSPSDFNLSIIPVAVNDGNRDFTLRYQQTFAGKMFTIGNTILVAPEDQDGDICDDYKDEDYINNANLSNDNYELCEYYADTNENFPTTKATLPASASGVDAKVKWAGLYWQALVKDDYNIKGMEIKLKHSKTSNYTTVNYSSLDYQIGAGHPDYLSYSAYADVTSYFVDNNLTAGEIYVGDIPVIEGKIENLGTYGAWTLVVIYEDYAEPLQNFSIYDGWQQVDGDNDVVEVDITGFYTPVNAPSIDAQVSVFTAEGDKLIPGDELNVKPSQQATFTTLTTFDSRINTAVPFSRTPSPSNNQGIDIQSFELGTTGADIILPKESSMTLQFTSSPVYDDNGNVIAQDRYWPSMIAFSAQLYIPEVCYDYTVSMGNQVRLNAEGRDINSSIYTNLPLNIEFLLRSEEADFIYFDTKAYITFDNPSPALTYNPNYAQMSPADANTYFSYLDHPEIESNSTIGEIALGSNVINNLNNTGGILTPQQTTYAILGYDIEAGTNLTTHFDINFESKIRFDLFSAPVTFNFSTHAPTGTNTYIPRCPTNPTYSPIALGFNVERVNAHTEPVESRFTLHTQVTGRPYSVDLVTYEGGVESTSTTPLDFRGVVELELIDASAFQNDSTAGYDTTCQRPNAIGEGTLIAFDPNGADGGRHTVTPTDLPGYIDTYALKDAAFRLWVLSTPIDTTTRQVVTHQCTDKSNSDDCLGKVYRETIDVNATGECVTQCTPANTACYPCLKTYYTSSICSRDNFAIRPESFHIRISDDNDIDSTVTPVQIAQNITTGTTNNQIRLAAGYDYAIDINTTNHSTISAITPYATGYFNSQFVYQANIPTVPDKLKSGSLAMIEFNDVIACSDKNQSTIALSFENGSESSHFRFPNAGNYKFWLSDSNWTIVDHKDYQFKPFPNVEDCVIGSTNSDVNTLAGCTIYSAKGDKVDILADVQPYRFSMSNIQVVRQPDNSKDYTFYNDFNNTYYSNLPSQPIDTSTSYIGLLKAKGKNGVVLSNFTKGCAATDIILDLNISTNTPDTDTYSPLHQYLQHTSRTDITWNAQAIGLDANITLTKNAFPDTESIVDGVTISPGEAQILLHTTFTKPKTNPIDPLLALYRGLDSASPDAQSKADMGDLIPTGENTASKDLIYYFTKVTPAKPLYDNVTGTSQNTPLFVDIYCSLGTNCEDIYDLTTIARNNAASWYSATMYDAATDGNIISLTTSLANGSGVVPAVSPSADIPFNDSNGSRTDINVSITGAGRPVTIRTLITLPPWLQYNPLRSDGYPTYDVRFISPSSWIGVGVTGNVVETESSTSATRRMNW